jgi:alpha-tubulin suppressor-like RCC1 family protein
VIAIGGRIALKSDGTVWTWGTSTTGDGTSLLRLSPVKATGLTKVVAISEASAWQPIPSDPSATFKIVKSDGTVWAWGNNYEGYVGDATTTNVLTPVQVHGLNNVGTLKLIP